MNDPLSVITLSLPLNGMISVKPPAGSRRCSGGGASFGDVGQVALSLFPIYFEKRDHVVPLTRDYCLLLVSFPDADHLHITDITPSKASGRGSRVRAAVEIVWMVLPGGDGVSSQVLRVQFNYFSGIIAWRPIRVSVILARLKRSDSVRDAEWRVGRSRAD